MTSVKPAGAPSNKSKSAASAPFPKGVSQPAIRALASIGYTHLDQLVNASEKELSTLHGMGPKALRILGETLQAQGKGFKP